MDVVTPFLQKWMCDFLKSKDAFFKRIASLDCEGNTQITITYKDERVVKVSITPTFNEESLSEIDKEKPVQVVTLNSKENLDHLLKNWKTFAEMKHLTFYFVNPFSKTEKKWIIMPYTHHRICDESALKSGLHSMFETVDITDETEARKRLA